MPLLKIDEEAFGQKQGMLGLVSKEGSSHMTKGKQQKPGERETGKDGRKERENAGSGV